MAHERAARLERRVQPLVRVEGHRVGLGEPGKVGGSLGAHHGGGAVRPVGVEPQAVLPGDGGQPGERVHGARADRARVADEQEGLVPFAAVLLDPALEGSHVDRQVVPHGDPSEAVRPVAEEVGRLLDPGVGLGRRVDEEPRAAAVHSRLADVPARPGPTGGEEAGEVRRVAPAHEETLGPGRHPEQAGQPPDALPLDLGGERRQLPRAHVGVDRGRQQVGQGPDGRCRGRDVAEEHRVPVEERVVEEKGSRLGEQPSRRHSLVFELGRQQRTQRARRFVPGHGPPGQRLEERGDLVDQPVAGLAEGLGAHLERGPAIAQVVSRHRSSSGFALAGRGEGEG